MTLNTVSSPNGTWYYVNNTNTGEQIQLVPCSGGLFADYAEGSRYGRQVPPFPGGLTGIASWRLGTPSSYAVLAPGDIATLYTSVNSFGNNGTLATPVWINSAGNERTLVQQDNRMRNNAPSGFGTSGNGQQIAQLMIKQGENVILLSQANCWDLASTLNSIGST